MLTTQLNYGSAFPFMSTLQRETKGEVVLVSRLCAALDRLNPALPPEAITAAVDEMTRDRVAGRAGFADPYYFSRLFKQKTGITPAKWRG